MPYIYKFFFLNYKKKIYLDGATWDTFVKKFFPCKYKKIFYKYMDQPGTLL